MYYNAAYLSGKFSGPPAQWEEFANAARSTTRDGVHGWVMMPDPAVFYALVYAQGGAVLNDAQNQVQFNSEAGLRALQLISTLSSGGAAYMVRQRRTGAHGFRRGQGGVLVWYDE